MLKVAGFTLVETNNMGAIDANDSTTPDTGAINDPHGGGYGYNGNWNDIEALCFHRSAVGTVKMADLQVMSEYQVDRLASLLLARYAMGHSYLRPEACFHIYTAS